MSARNKSAVGIDHPTVVPANFDPETETDGDESGDAAEDERADR